MCVCVCVCEREKETERHRGVWKKEGLYSSKISLSLKKKGGKAIKGPRLKEPKQQQQRA